MFDYLWSKLGVEQDAYFTIDTTGVEFAGGGTEPHAARPGAVRRDDAPAGPLQRPADRSSRCRRRHPRRRQSGTIRRRGLYAAAGVELSTHVVGVAQRARRVCRARHSRPGHLCRSGRRDGGGALRLASAGSQRASRPHVAAGLSRARETSSEERHHDAPRAPARHPLRRHASFTGACTPTPSSSATAAGRFSA